VPSINIVNQLYPPAFIDRIVQPRDSNATKDKRTRGGRLMTQHAMNPMQSLNDFLTNSSCDDALKMSRPIAEIFPEVTIIFADISGFTAWSSEREPTQVFQLLEVLFAAFDDVAKRLGVFKVETIGDCYVGVLGLPAPFRAHAVVMCRFARAMHDCMNDLTKRLEVQLGPGTSDLQLRIGLHSGPVTAGVLRGEKSRFQLFGDTMNTAARMESTGEPGKIHVSKATCNFLTASGKQHWLTTRRELVNAKGKGELQTFWVNPQRKVSGGKQRREYLHEFKEDSISLGLDLTSDSGIWRHLSVDEIYPNETEVSKKRRLVEWNTEVLIALLGRLEAMRPRVGNEDSAQGAGRSSTKRNFRLSRSAVKSMHSDIECMTTELSFGNNETNSFNAGTVPRFDPLQSSDLGSPVRKQLRDYVADIADLYNDLPFRK
jgi:class 3 adenylate cyclase